MYRSLQQRLVEHIRQFLRQKYDVDLPNLVVDQPPKVEMGEYALPFSFELAKRLRKAPRKIAEEVAAELPPIEGFEKPEVAGAGYINFRVKRGDAARSLAKGEIAAPPAQGGKILVEHTSINPNKAAHIGHLRNAILGDTFVRLLRAAGRTGRRPELHRQHRRPGRRRRRRLSSISKNKSMAEIRSRSPSQHRASTTTAGISTPAPRSGTSRTDRGESKKVAPRHAAMPSSNGGNETAEIADLISDAVLRRHLETMLRLDIEYDFLPRESEILHLQVLGAAFEQLEEAKASSTSRPKARTKAAGS